MKQSSFLKTRRGQRLVILLVATFVVGGLPLLACAVTRSQPSISVTIVNNSSLEFRHVYLSPVDGNNWGPDQLNGNVLAPGASYTLSNLSCNSSSIKVVIEDQNGCFFYKTVSCSENTTWTVANNATPDCGG
jgi:hypothetical protein